MSNETVYHGVPRRPIARKVQAGQYTYLQTLSGTNLAKFDSKSNQTYDRNGRFYGNGNQLDRLLPI